MTTAVIPYEDKGIIRFFNEKIETVANHQKKIGAIASSIFGFAGLIAQGDSLSFSLAAKAEILGSFNYLIIHAVNNICLNIFKFLAKNFCRLCTSSIETRAKFNASLDTITSSKTFKAIKVAINVLCASFSTSYLSIYILPAVAITSIALGVGLILFKIGKVYNHTLASYNLRVQKSLDSEKVFSKSSIVGKAMRSLEELYFDNQSHVYNLVNSDQQNSSFFAKALEKYGSCIPDSAKSKIKSDLENFDPELYCKIACLCILQIIKSDLPPHSYWQSLGLSPKTPADYPSIIKPEDRELLQKIHQKFSKLTKEEKKELKNCFALHLTGSGEKTYELSNEIREFSQKILQNNPQIMENLYRATLLHEMNDRYKEISYKESLKRRIH